MASEEKEILNIYSHSPKLKEIVNGIEKYHQIKIHLKGLRGSSKAVVSSVLQQKIKHDKLIILSDRDSAAYFKNDIESFIEGQKILQFPSPFKNDDPQFRHNTLSLQRIDLMNIISKPSSTGRIIITWPEALVEKVVTREMIATNTTELKSGSKVDVDFLIDFLHESGFEAVDFATEAGCFSIRGGIIDIYSFAHPLPYRIVLNDDIIESIHSYDPESQLSSKKMDVVTIIPDVEKVRQKENFISFFNFIRPDTLILFDNLIAIREAFTNHYELLLKTYKSRKEANIPDPKKYCLTADDLLNSIEKFNSIELGSESFFSADMSIEFQTQPQPSFNKNFKMLGSSLVDLQKQQYVNYIFSESNRQIERIYAIFEDINKEVSFKPVYKNLQHGFIDNELKISCFTEHEIFNRFHNYKQEKVFTRQGAISLKELYELRPGDFITHINHGIGRFSGLEKIDVNGKKQESIRIEYKGGDLLYLSIHSLHKISRYVGREGQEPKLHRLGSDAWETLKNRTKSRVKDIARDLIKLYAKRKAEKGFAFSPDTYMQTELEASFIYEDTPDQAKSTEDVKRDMEKPYPMDRLICGDVGYGKTEIAIRAAFKAVADSKQVAVLVPTTILAFQHYKTFSERLKDFPCNVDYISRFKTAKYVTATKKKLAEGRLDVIIGTHKLLSKELKFKELGLLIIDEEQKFGVAAKEKLRALKVNVDTLSLTATPIPRTLQFSLMGVRDLSIINTPPPNRQAIDTVLKPLDPETIRESINRELDRGGQVFFVHNRIKDLNKVAKMVRDLIPHAKVAVAHGQMEGVDLEEIMLNFIDGYYDILVSTNIIESGLDIPNANTIIINDAQNFGLSDLYQMRGRVGRSNAKAYCYLFIPSFAALTSDARKRLAAIEEFSDLGSGLHIAMRDLDIRGAGNLLGAEQSGFISEIGLDMYKKILDEALSELKMQEFNGLFEEKEEFNFFRECVVETDLEVLIPDEYVTNIEERLILYNKLNRISDEKALKKYESEMQDRFGRLPYQTNDLLDLIRLKWSASKLGIEKIIMKNNTFRAYFPYSHSTINKFHQQVFSRLLTYVQTNPDRCKFSEKPNGLELIVRPVQFVDEAIEITERIGKE